MSLPAQLLKEAEAAAMEYYPSDRHFMAGVQWLFTRLSEMSEGEFDADSARQESYRRDDEQTKTNREEYLDAFSFIEGARHQHALSQAALLKAREEIAQLEKVISFHSATDPYQSCTKETILAAVAYERARRALEEAE